MNALLAMVLLAAAGLAAVIGVELLPAADEPEPAIRVAVAAGEAASVITPAASSAATDPVLLARPLFSQTRRPPDVAAPGAVPSAEPLPRMTGIMIDGPNRLAIFAGAAGGKAVSVVEGGRVGAFTVQSIAPRQVTVVGPGGQRTLRTAFDPSLPPPAAPPGVLPGPGAFAPSQYPGLQFPPGGAPGELPSGRFPIGPVAPQGGSASPFINQPPAPGYDAGTGSPSGAVR